MSNDKNIKPLITIIKNDDIFSYLKDLNSHGVKVYILDFDNFGDFIIETKDNFIKKDKNFDCLVQSKSVYTDFMIEDDFEVVTNETFILEQIKKQNY